MIYFYVYDLFRLRRVEFIAPFLPYITKSEIKLLLKYVTVVSHQNFLIFINYRTYFSHSHIFPIVN